MDIWLSSNVWLLMNLDNRCVGTGLISVVEVESQNAYSVVPWGKLSNCFLCGWVHLIELLWLLHILIIFHTLRFSSFWHYDLIWMLALIFMFFMIDDKKNPSFFSFIFIFGELYPDVLSTLWLIIEFECPLSVNNLDIFYPGCNLPLHPNIFFPKSKNSLFWKEFEHNHQRWEANVSHRIHEWLNENVSTGHRIPPEVFTTVQAIVTCLA